MVWTFHMVLYGHLQRDGKFWSRMAAAKRHWVGERRWCGPKLRWLNNCVGSTTMLSTKGTVETQHAKWLGWKRHRHSYRHFFPALLQGRSGAKAPKHKATTANQSRHEALRLPNERGARTTVPKRQRQQNLRRPVQREAWYRQQVWYR